ncbi:hypothetical protein NL676_001195 [Syzygium grande]|nr:hypothetical protein NL676_001195 [Syzygium grande]
MWRGKRCATSMMEKQGTCITNSCNKPWRNHRPSTDTVLNTLVTWTGNMLASPSGVCDAASSYTQNVLRILKDRRSLHSVSAVSVLHAAWRFRRLKFLNGRAASQFFLSRPRVAFRHLHPVQKKLGI